MMKYIWISVTKQAVRPWWQKGLVQDFEVVWFRVDEIFQLRSNKKNTKVKGKGRNGSSAPTLPIQLTV